MADCQFSFGDGEEGGGGVDDGLGGVRFKRELDSQGVACGIWRTNNMGGGFARSLRSIMLTCAILQSPTTVA